jgi:hypothetical protein
VPFPLMLYVVTSTIDPVLCTPDADISLDGGGGKSSKARLMVRI